MYQRYTYITPSNPLGYTPTQIDSKTDKKIIFGFLPFWLSSQVESQHFSYYTDIGYFGFEVNPDGSLKTNSTPTQREPGYHTFTKASTQQLLQALKQEGKKIHLVIRIMDEDIIASILSSPQNTNRLIDTISTLAQTEQADGINIDFEVESSVAQQHATQFTQFIAGLSQSLKPQNILLSIDVYGSAASRPNLWQLQSLAPYADYIIVMAYDYTLRNASYSGHLAPLYGNNNKNIMQHINEISAQVPMEKILLGIAAYGYSWQTVDQSIHSPTFPNTSQLITYNQLFNQLDENGQFVWDTHSGTGKAVSIIDEKTYQTTFESPQAINLKIDLVDQANLAGVAVWAIGYEHQSTQFQNLLRQVFDR